MGLDRTLLNGMLFVSLCPNETQHARIPNELIQSIGNLDALGVYAVLRSKPPTHRWKTDLVKRAIKAAGLNIGENRVEKAMAYLNKSGWISYVILKNDRGEREGSIVQVHRVRLPIRLWGKVRSIQFDRNQSFRIYDFDGETQLSVREFNAGWPGLEEESTEEQASRQEAVEDPLPRDPEDRDSAELYNFYQKEDPPTPSREGANAVPLREELRPEPCGSGRGVDVGPCSTIPVEVDVGPSSTIPVGLELPGEYEVLSTAAGAPDIDWDQLREMARAARGSEEARGAYHKHLVEVVFPALKDPPVDDKRWRSTDNLEWCRNSAKGRFVLSCAVEDDWTPDLARSFRRCPLACALSECRMLLRTGMFASRSPANLEALVDGKKSGRGAAWKEMLKMAKEIDQKLKEDLKRRIMEFPSREKCDTKLKAEARKKMGWGKADDYLFPDETLDDQTLFFTLFSMHYRACRGPIISERAERWFRERNEESAQRMARFVASNKLGTVVALSEEVPATEIWGFDWDSVKREHLAIASELVMGAKLYGIEQQVLADTTIYDRGPELDKNTRDALEGLAQERRLRAPREDADQGMRHLTGNEVFALPKDFEVPECPHPLQKQ